MLRFRILSLFLVLTTLMGMSTNVAAFIIAVATVEEKKNTILEAVGSDWAVRAELDSMDTWPEDVAIRAEEVSGDEYIVSTGIENITFARFFDISLMAGGAEVQPEGRNVRVEIAVPELEADADEIQVVHFALPPIQESANPTTEAEPSMTEVGMAPPKKSLLKTGSRLMAAVEEQLPVEDNHTPTPENVEYTVNEKDGQKVLSFEASGFSVYGIIGRTIEKTVLASDGLNYKITVSYTEEAGIPEGSELAVNEMEGEAYQDYLDRAAIAMSLAGFNFGRVFDISIVDPDGYEVQPAGMVDVSIELLDEAGAADPYTVIHFTGEEEVPVEMEAETDGNVVRFSTDGFSAYAIVQGPAAVPLGWHKVSSTDQLAEIGSEGLYIGHSDGYYFTNVQDDKDGRKGIKKTTPASTYPGTSAEVYYFESYENNTYYIYYLDANNVKHYVKNVGSGNTYNGLTFTTNKADERTVFTVTDKGDGKFNVSSNGWFWNQQGGSSGSRFCAWNSADANSSLNFWYYSNVTEDPYGLDGQTYGLMNWNGGAAGKALMNSSETENSLDSKPLTVMSTSNNSSQLFAPNDSDISMWKFHWIDQDKYYITTVVDGSTKYLRVAEDGLSLVSESDDNCKIQVVPGSGTHSGEVCLKSGNHILTYSGNIETGFSISGSAGTEWLYLVELSELTSDYFMTYTASKVSVSDTEITNGSRVIVYTRSWNETKKRYDFYAIGSDGTLVPVYEDGDSIEWVSGQLNKLLWNFVEYYWDGTTDPNHYYELYNQYSERYIAPQITGDQILSNDPIGINLNGRRDGKYYSTILAWDEEDYSYVGLKVEDGHIVVCPKNEAMDFYFAVMDDLNVDDSLHTIDTVDHEQYGITMKIIDLENKNDNITGYMNSILGSKDGGTGTNLQQGLLSTSLGSEGYPIAVKTNTSLEVMYSNGELRQVNQLFIESTYHSSGYFEYDSTQNYAYLTDDNTFKVYRELGSYDSAGGRNTLKHGQFFPFNDLQAGAFASVNGNNLYTFTETNYQQLLPDSDPRKYEQLYSLENDLNKKVDTYFAVELEASFTQTPNGQDAWGHDIIFEFTGDDDFWLYVDGELVIDLGGIHSSVPGSVNFRTGEVRVNGRNTTIRDLFYNNYLGRGNHTEAEAQAYVDEIFVLNENGQWVFKDYSTHDMKMFYMERGAGASNLKMRFNLAAVKKGSVQLSKELDGVDYPKSVKAEFPYQILYKTEDDGSEHYLTNHLPDNSEQNDDYVFYKDSVNPVKYQQTLEIDGITYQDVFFLKPGETADISFPENMTTYRIVECGINTNVYNGVEVNGETINGTARSGNRKDFGIDEATTEERPKVKYVNKVNPDALRTLTIKKVLYDETGTQAISYTADGTYFSFRLYLASEYEDLDVADMHSYHVKDPDGYYCSWNRETQKFEMIGNGITEYNDLTEQQQQDSSINFTTSIYGTIGKIPAGYSVEVRNVLAGTQYRVEERTGEIPDGYSFQKYVFNNTGAGHAVESTTNNGLGINGTVVSKEEDSDEPYVNICNLKGWGLRVNKIWRDADYMSQRDATYFAVYAKGEGEALNLVEGTVRQLPYTVKPQTLYWYFEHLPVVGTSGVGDYVIREVRLTGEVTVSETGAVSGYSDIIPLHDNSSIELSGLQKGESNSSSFTYSVRYAEGEVSSDSNVRVDTVTNDRPGIILKKTDWSGNPLPGAEFTLKEGDNEIGTFTSGTDGIITVAFLGEGKNYTLTETNTPQGFHGLESPLTIRAENGIVTVNGNNMDGECHTLTQASGNTLAAVTIKNRPFTFKAVKKDGDTQQVLSGVKFALHKQYTVNGVTQFETTPMVGYDGLVSGGDGVIPEINENLPAGTYQLREIKATPGYELLSGYIHFTISATGEITLGEHPENVTLGAETETDVSELSYVLTILNYQRKKVSFQKVDVANNSQVISGAKFDLYSLNNEGEREPLYNGLKSDEDGLLVYGGNTTIFELPIGIYHLIETEAPEGYIIKTTPVVITITSNDISYDEGTILSSSGNGKSYDESTKVYTLKVSNSSGVELPATGGLGLTPILLTGATLTLTSAAIFIRRKKHEE